MKKLLLIAFVFCLSGSPVYLFFPPKLQSDIPKIIHYCWFGDHDLPDYAKQALNSWQKTNPDFHIKRWDEHNFNVHRTPFLSQAYDRKNDTAFPTL